MHDRIDEKGALVFNFRELFHQRGVVGQNLIVSLDHFVLTFEELQMSDREAIVSRAYLIVVINVVVLGADDGNRVFPIQSLLRIGSLDVNVVFLLPHGAVWVNHFDRRF